MGRYSFHTVAMTAILLGATAYAAEGDTGPVSPDALIAAGRYDEAEAMLTSALGAGRFIVVEPPLRRLAEARPDVPRYAYYLGFCLLGSFRYAEAEEWLRRAVEGEPTQHGWMKALAKALLEQNRNVAAAEVLDRAIALSPQPDYRFAKAMCLMNAGELAAAEAELRLCLREDPNHAEALFKLGIVLADRGDVEEAAEALGRCLGLNPRHVEARFRLALAEARLGNDARAIAELEQVVREIPGHVGALYNLGRILMRSGRREEGRRTLERFREASELEDRIQFQRELVIKNPSELEYRMTAAALLMEAGRFDESLEQLESARTLDPFRSSVYRRMAEVFARIGRVDDSRRAEAFAAELEAQGR